MGSLSWCWTYYVTGSSWHVDLTPLPSSCLYHPQQTHLRCTDGVATPDDSLYHLPSYSLHHSLYLPGSRAEQEWMLLTLFTKHRSDGIGRFQAWPRCAHTYQQWSIVWLQGTKLAHAAKRATQAPSTSYQPLYDLIRASLPQMIGCFFYSCVAEHYHSQPYTFSRSLKIATYSPP